MICLTTLVLFQASLWKRAVDLLDMDAPILDGLDHIGDLPQLARGFLGICVGACVGVFDHPAVPITRLTQRTGPTSRQGACPSSYG